MCRVLTVQAFLSLSNRVRVAPTAWLPCIVRLWIIAQGRHHYSDDIAGSIGALSDNHPKVTTTFPSSCEILLGCARGVK